MIAEFFPLIREVPPEAYEEMMEWDIIEHAGTIKRVSHDTYFIKGSKYSAIRWVKESLDRAVMVENAINYYYDAIQFGEGQESVKENTKEDEMIEIGYRYMLECSGATHSFVLATSERGNVAKVMDGLDFLFEDTGLSPVMHLFMNGTDEQAKEVRRIMERWCSMFTGEIAEIVPVSASSWVEYDDCSIISAERNMRDDFAEAIRRFTQWSVFKANGIWLSGADVDLVTRWPQISANDAAPEVDEIVLRVPGLMPIRATADTFYGPNGEARIQIEGGLASKPWLTLVGALTLIAIYEQRRPEKEEMTLFGETKSPLYNDYGKVIKVGEELYKCWSPVINAEKVIRAISADPVAVFGANQCARIRIGSDGNGKVLTLLNTVIDLESIHDELDPDVQRQLVKMAIAKEALSL